MLKRHAKSKSKGLICKPLACTSNNIEKLVEGEVIVNDSPDLFESDDGKAVVQNENNDLIEIFSSCGLCITDESSNILRSDQAVFVRTLSCKLLSERNVQKFIESFQEYYSNEKDFLKSLSPTVTSSECDVARGNTQESLIRLLLQIEDLQCPLADYLLDRLGELALRDEETNSDISPIAWVKLILQPFRYLNSIVNSKKICERLFDIIFSSPDKMIKQEVIVCLPDIIADTEHRFAANELSKLLRCELDLMPSILDALTNLSIQSEIRREVGRNLMDSLKSCTIEYVPNVVKFLLFASDAQSYDEVINGLRAELLSSNNSSSSSEVVDDADIPIEIDTEGIKILIFNHIRNAFLACKPLADAWHKNISQSSSSVKYRPLDMIVTLILYDICTDSAKKSKVETTFKSRIKNGQFTVALIRETFEHFTPVLKEYFPSLMSILSKMLKSVDATQTEFVTTFYLSCFEQVDQQLCRSIIKELLAYIGAGDMNDSQIALKILSQIADQHKEKIRPLALLLRVLLNKMVDLPLNDIEHLMDIVCGIAFIDSSEETPDTKTLKNDITSLIEKYITSSNLKLLKCGIVSAVMAIKHVAMQSDEETNLWPDKASDDFDENHLSPRARKALPFLRLIIDGTRTFPEAQGLAFDQFSLMLMKCKSLDKSLLFYTSMIMKENMKKYFLICNDEVKDIDFVECALKFGLNEDEEFVVLNLTPTLIEEQNCNASAGLRMYSMVLPSLLRLIRGLEYEDLREIDGLLECPVVVPAPKVLDEFSLQTPQVQTVIMDSLFHLANWFREIINCFARIIKLPAGKKVLVRLRTLVWLQKLIAQYLPQVIATDYCPPKCNFHKTTSKIPVLGADKKKRKSTNGDKKRKRNSSKTPDIRRHLVARNTTASATQINPTQQSTVVEESEDEADKNQPPHVANMKNYKHFFRELDLDIWIMLTLPLTLNPEPEQDWEFKAQFTPSELLFIMEDLVEKLHFVLISCNKRLPFKNASANLDIGVTCSSLYTEAPELIVKNMIKLIPRLCAHLEAVAQFCQNLLSANDSVFDASGMFVTESKEIKSSFALILKAVSVVFSWSGFEDANHEELFIAALSKIANRLETSEKSTEIDVLVKECCVYFSGFQESVLHLECALNLVNVIEALHKHSEQREISKILSTMCWKFLSHHWYTWDGCEEKGATFNRQIEYLLTAFFNFTNNKLKAVHSMSDWLKDEVTTLNSKDASLTTLPNINKANCNVLLRVLLKILASATKQALDRDTDRKEKLNVWLKVMNTLDSIVNVLKCQYVRMNLICFVKGVPLILRLFVNHGIAICSQLFRSESSLVTQILKTLQVTTRYLQKICDNTKLTEDGVLCAYLPSTRSLLESILLKVKNVMVFNGCTEAFFVGSMRNKDLQGQDILSQSTVDENSEPMDIDVSVNEAPEDIDPENNVPSDEENNAASDAEHSEENEVVENSAGEDE
ncbi:Fanconi anemia group D2 protein [Planococcus citri]|uniref:Fanconi anemia group D2 protein n=1 Tax=Planococcus citri TaxID=170843 RepID=UPI0031F87F4A